MSHHSFQAPGDWCVRWGDVLGRGRRVCRAPGASPLAPSSPLGLDSGQQCLPQGLWGARHSPFSG